MELIVSRGPTGKELDRSGHVCGDESFESRRIEQASDGL
jgi:hypothetical protein